MEINEHKLITLVQKNECLFNKKDPEFKNAQKKKVIWECIGKELGVAGEYCARKFNNLRDKFSREIKIQNAPSGSAAVQPSKWPFFTEMQFLRGHMVQRRQISNIFSTIEKENVTPIETSDESEMMQQYIDYVPENNNYDSSHPSTPPIQSPVTDTMSTKKRKNCFVEDDICRGFEQSSKAFKKLCDEMTNKDNIVMGFTRMAEGTLTRMSHEKKMRTVKKLIDVLFEAEFDIYG